MVIGIDIGGTKTRIGRAHSTVVADKTLDFTTPQDYPTAKNHLIQSITQLAAGEQLEAIGIVAASTVDNARGLIPYHKYLKWRDATIGPDLAKHFDCPVHLGHDATAAALAEALYGNGRGFSPVLYVTISTGIGIGYIVDGQPVKSKFPLEGGEMLMAYQQTSDKLISFEQLVSGAAIYARYGRIAAEINDQDIWKNIGSWLAVGLYNYIVITQPSRVVLGGGVTVHFDKFQRSLFDYLQQTHPSNPLPSIVTAKYIETAPLIGALHIARHS